MTGYLWLCEKCAGTGKLFRMFNRETYTYRSVDTRVGSFNPYYFPEYPSIEPCRECKGRGYWEAA